MILRKIKMKLNSKLQLYILKIFQKQVTIGKNVNVRKRFNPNINGGELIIGNNVFFNNDCSINSQGKISIGSNCLFGENVKLYDHNHVFKNLEEPISKQGMKIGEIIIGNNCWVGSNVTILPNVTIGDNVVIGANCLVFKSVPSNSVVKANSTLIIEKRI